MSSVTVSVAPDNGVSAHHFVDSQTVIQLNQDSGDGEPPLKRVKTEDGDMNPDQSIKQILFNINKAICLRLDAIEDKLETISARTKYLEEKVDTISHQTRSNNNIAMQTPIKIQTEENLSWTPGSRVKQELNNATLARRNSAVIVGLPQERPSTESTPSPNSNSLDHGVHSLGTNVTLITLNTEEDFPNGSWLGDESNPEMRVRVPITPSDMLHIHSNCRTAEKMALTLLDYLFDRDIQAASNLSGMGKHGKKQLDPLMIYGIRCHLIHKFNVTEQDWHRIKQNIDSKCRTAFRRKNRGLPLTVKAFRGKAPPTYVHMGQGMGEMSIQEMGQSDDDSLQQAEDAELQIAQDGVDVQQSSILHQSEIIHSAGGEIQVLHATPEQVAQLQQTHQIQILQGDQVMQLQQGDGGEPIHVQVSMAHDPSGIQVVTANTGETITINPTNTSETITINPVGSGDDESQDNATDDADENEQ